MSKVYALIDDKNCITRIEGGYTESNIEDIRKWNLIDEGEGDRYNLCQSQYLPKPLTDENGVFIYKYEDGEIIERSEHEKSEDYKETSFEVDKLSLFLEAISIQPKPADRVGYMWKPIFNIMSMNVGWEEVVDPNYNPTGSGTYINPYVYKIRMIIEEGLWYTDGEDIWEAIKTGIPQNFEDKEYFDIIEV